MMDVLQSKPLDAPHRMFRHTPSSRAKGWRVGGNLHEPEWRPRGSSGRIRRALPKTGGRDGPEALKVADGHLRGCLLIPKSHSAEAVIVPPGGSPWNARQTRPARRDRDRDGRNAGPSLFGVLPSSRWLRDRLLFAER